MFDISPIQILIVLVIALVVFGPKRLPEMGKSVGRGMREFRGAVAGITDDDDVPTRAAAAPSEANEAPASATGAVAQDAGAANESPSTETSVNSDQ